MTKILRFRYLTFVHSVFSPSRLVLSPAPALTPQHLLVMHIICFLCHSDDLQILHRALHYELVPNVPVPPAWGSDRSRPNLHARAGMRRHCQRLAPPSVSEGPRCPTAGGWGRSSTIPHSRRRRPSAAAKAARSRLRRDPFSATSSRFRRDARRVVEYLPADEATDPGASVHGPRGNRTAEAVAARALRDCEQAVVSEAVGCLRSPQDCGAYPVGMASAV